MKKQAEAAAGPAIQFKTRATEYRQGSKWHELLSDLSWIEHRDYKIEPGILEFKAASKDGKILEIKMDLASAMKFYSALSSALLDQLKEKK